LENEIDAIIGEMDQELSNFGAREGDITRDRVIVLDDSPTKNLIHMIKIPIEKCVGLYLEDLWELSQMIGEYEGLMLEFYCTEVTFTRERIVETLNLHSMSQTKNKTIPRVMLHRILARYQPHEKLFNLGLREIKVSGCAG
jgi:hypothetical protein